MPDVSLVTVIVPFSRACPSAPRSTTAVNVVTTMEIRDVSYARIGLDEAVIIAMMGTLGTHTPRSDEAE